MNIVEKDWMKNSLWTLSTEDHRKSPKKVANSYV